MSAALAETNRMERAVFLLEDMPKKASPAMGESTRTTRTRLDGFIKHPGVALDWFVVNSPPNKLISLGLALLYYRGSVKERAANIRREAFLGLFGPYSLKAVHDHFDPFDFHRMREDMYMLNRRRKRGTSLQVQFLKPSPVLELSLSGGQLLLLPDAENKTLALPLSVERAVQTMAEESDKTRDLAVVFPRTDRLSQGEDQATLVKNLGIRLEALVAIRKTLCDPQVRSKDPGGDEKRALIFNATSGSIRDLASRRMRPTVCLEETYALSEMFKTSLAFERSPKVLMAMTNWAKDALLGCIDFIKAESQENIYQGRIQSEQLLGIIEDMASAIVSLNRRGIQVDNQWVRSDFMAEIKAKLNDQRLGKDARKIADKAALILAMASRNDLPMLGRDSLKPLLGASMFSDIFTLGENKAEEIVIFLEKGLTLNRGGNCTKPELLQIIKWFSLRFPFHDEIVIQEDDGTTRIMALQVKEDLVADKLDYFPNTYLAKDNKCQNSFTSVQMVPV